MLEVNPFPPAFLHLQVDPPPWAPHHQPHERWPSLSCSLWCRTSDAASFSSTVLAATSLLPHAKVGSHLLAALEFLLSHILDIRGPRSSLHCRPAAEVPMSTGPLTEGSEVAPDIRRPLWWWMHVAKNGCSGRTEVLWPERCPNVGEGGWSGAWGPLSWGSLHCALLLPLRHRGCPAPPLRSSGLQAPPRPVPGVLSTRRWQQCSRGVLSAPPLTRCPAGVTAPCARQWLRGGEASRHAAGGKGRPSWPAQGLPVLHKSMADGQVLPGPCFPTAQRCPWSVERDHLFCTEPRGRGEERAQRPSGYNIGVAWEACWRESLQVSIFKNNDSLVLGQTWTLAHCQELSSRHGYRGS